MQVNDGPRGNKYIKNHHAFAAGCGVLMAGNLQTLYAAHIVLDLETLSTEPNAAVASIGAAALAADGTLLSSLHVAINDQGQDMRHIDEIGADSTVQWWAQQSPEARAASVDAQDAVPAAEALGYFSAWVARITGADAGESEVRVWGNGSVFDNVILRTLYRDCHPLGYAEPWQWRFDRDMRALLELYPAAKDVGEFVGIKHHAEHDALHEAKQLAKALQLREAAQKPSALLNVLCMAAGIRSSTGRAPAELRVGADAYEQLMQEVSVLLSGAPDRRQALADLLGVRVQVYGDVQEGGAA